MERRYRPMRWKLAVVAAASVSLVACKPTAENSTTLWDSTNVIFTRGAFHQPTATLRITDTNEVRRLLTAIQLEPKERCACGHEYLAIFQMPGGEVWVSFCNHCFDVLGRTRTGTVEGASLYKMPKEFYAQFLKLARADTNQFWFEPER